MKLPEITIERAGEKIQLTQQELMNIFYKMEHYYHEEDVETELTYRLEFEVGSEEDNSKMKAILDDENTISDLAEYYEERIGDDDTWHYIINNAIKDYLETYELKEVKEEK